MAVVSTPTSIPTVAGYQFNGIVMGPAFAEAHAELVDPFGSSLTLRLRHGLDSVDDLRQEMDEAGIEIDLQDRGFVEVGAERLFTLEATTMWVASVLALLVGLPVAYQLLRRDAAAGRGTIETVLAIGASGASSRSPPPHGEPAGRYSRGRSCPRSGARVAARPVGLARNAEVERGIYIDVAVLAIGVPVFVVAVGLSGLSPSRWRRLASRRPVPSERRVSIAQPRVPLALGIGWRRAPVGRRGRRHRRARLRLAAGGRHRGRGIEPGRRPRPPRGVGGRLGRVHAARPGSASGSGGGAERGAGRGRLWPRRLGDHRSEGRGRLHPLSA